MLRLLLADEGSETAAVGSGCGFTSDSPIHCHSRPISLRHAYHGYLVATAVWGGSTRLLPVVEDQNARFGRSACVCKNLGHGRSHMSSFFSGAPLINHCRLHRGPPSVKEECRIRVRTCIQRFYMNGGRPDDTALSVRLQ